MVVTSLQIVWLKSMCLELILERACKQGDLAMVKSCIFLGSNSEGALQLACLYNQMSVVEYFLGLGTPVNSSMVSSAIMNDSAEMLRALLEAGAPVNKGHTDFADILEHWEIRKLL